MPTTIRVPRFRSIRYSFHPVISAIEYLFAVLALPVLQSLSPPAHADNVISRPVGFVRIIVSPNSDLLASIPFQPFDQSLRAILAGQLMGATNEVGTDHIPKWDSSTSPRSKRMEPAIRCLMDSGSETI